MKMDYQTCVLINGPLVILNIMINAFYIFCMVCPQHGERIKQPLKLLLLSLICATGTYLISFSAMFFFGLLSANYMFTEISFLLSECSLTTSMTSSVWLNFFYYTQIVSAQRPLFIWIKKNSKSIIYCIWVVERIYSVFDFAVSFIDTVYFNGFDYSNNFTMDYGIHIPESLAWLANLSVILTFILKAHFFFCLCVMVMSSGRTVVYLCRHMRHMVANGQTLFCPKLSSQVRVTVTGILQGILYVFCALWMTYNFLSQYMFFSSISLYIHFTIINLYMSLTTFNLGVGQAVFRQRAASIWTGASQWCKVTKV